MALGGGRTIEQATYAEVSKNEWSVHETSRLTLRELVEEAGADALTHMKRRT